MCNGTVLTIGGVWLASTAVLFGQSVKIDFDSHAIGKAPTGWTATQTGKGAASWTVVEDTTAPSKPNVLKQSGVATYPVCLKDDADIKDGFVEVKFKPVSGREDQ